MDRIDVCHVVSHTFLASIVGFESLWGVGSRLVTGGCFQTKYPARIRGGKSEQHAIIIPLKIGGNR